MNTKQKIYSDLIKYILAIGFSLLLSYLLIAAVGYDASHAMKALFSASFDGYVSFCSMLVKMTPLLFAGVAVAFAYSGNVFNLGIEGQLLLGAAAAAYLGVQFGGLPSTISIPLILLIAALAGACWAIIPAYLKTKGVSEVITTIMFNYIASRLVAFLVKGPLKFGGNPQSELIAQGTRLPIFVSGTTLHIGFLIALALAIVSYIVLYHTWRGYDIRAVGFNSVAAQYAGIQAKRSIFSSMIISGAIAGIGGGVEILGVAYQIFEGFSPGYGFTAIAISVIANNNPLAVLLSSMVFGVMGIGSNMMQRSAGVSAVFVNVLQSLIVLGIVVIRSKKMQQYGRSLVKCFRRALRKEQRGELHG